MKEETGESRVNGAEYVNEFAASQLIGVPVPMLRRWRNDRGGPRFCRLEGRSVRYKV